jgi:hypothetical protein
VSWYTDSSVEFTRRHTAPVTHAPETRVLIEVCDTGMGMSEVRPLCLLGQNHELRPPTVPVGIARPGPIKSKPGVGSMNQNCEADGP